MALLAQHALADAVMGEDAASQRWQWVVEDDSSSRDTSASSASSSLPPTQDSACKAPEAAAPLAACNVRSSARPGCAVRGAPPPANLQYKRGDLCGATEQFILQQCCCTATKAHGLSATLAAAFPRSCPYAGRRNIPGRSDCAIFADRPRVGSIVVLGARRVVSLFGQYGPGRPAAYYKGSVPDTAAARLDYFREGLRAVRALRPASIALPLRIGCGLAGGHWPAYRAALEEFARAAPRMRIVLYDDSF